MIIRVAISKNPGNHHRLGIGVSIESKRRLDSTAGSELRVLDVGASKRSLFTRGKALWHVVRGLCYILREKMNSPQPTTGRVRSETERDIDGVNKALTPGIKSQLDAHPIHRVAK